MKIAIIGGGAAGMMTAATILERNTSNVEVFLIEKNSLLGNKVIISGGGRCNVTTGIRDMKVLLTKYPRGTNFLRTALYNFPPEKVYNWFQGHGVPLKIEKDLRVFPKSDNGKDIVGVFEDMFKKKKAQILFKRNVVSISHIDNKFTITFKDHDDLVVDKVVLATGGQAYRHTGSTGDGYTFAEQLGHKISMLAPSLSSFVTEEKWTAKVAGVSFQRAGFYIRGEKNYEFVGPFVFTHKGISGPAIFAMSALSAFEKYDKAHPMKLMLDVLPDISHEELEKKLTEYVKNNHKKTILTTLHEYVPWSLAEIFCELLEISPEKMNAEIPKKTLHKTIELLKRCPFSVIGRGAGDEFVTAGGVDLAEIDSKTMESKICPGLYFAGEIMNIDGFTGGFNLQASWATGRLAGEHASMV
ncbi:MAG: NAD(P)/FAD-dependent oxidoreductase [Candidatus Gracilibacteria bacterium]